MTKHISIASRQEAISATANHYAPFCDVANLQLLEDLAALAGNFQRTAEQVVQENRLLRIGIIGQIKRGKSSFINTLLFNSEDMLPKAATPMTAALTRIRYAEQASASVEFYTLEEWRRVTSQAETAEAGMRNYTEKLEAWKTAQSTHVKRGSQLPRPVEYTLTDEAKACQELCQMVRLSGLDVDAWLGKTQTLDAPEGNAGLIRQMNQFVGAQGKFTPIVKSTELCLSIDSLKSIEVIDTPGLNDPVISRGRRTQEFMGQCDVVFLLSNCGAFLDKHDMGLLAQNIPHKGIRNIVLIGSLFDGVLEDEGHKYASIRDALPSLTRKLAEQATHNVELVCRADAQLEGLQSPLMTTLRKALPPIFVSARCRDLARKGEHISEEEAKTLANLRSMFKGFTWTPAALDQVSNFAAVETRLAELTRDKESILAGRFDGLMQGVQQELRLLLQRIHDDASARRKNLQDGDLQQMQDEQKALVARINGGTQRVNAVFDQYSIKVEKRLSELLFDLRDRAMAVKRVKSVTGSREEVSREWAGTERHGFLWLQKRDVYRDVTRSVPYTYANTHEAIDLLEDFVQRSCREIHQASISAINLESFRNDVKLAVKDLFDFSDSSFDPQSVLLALSNAVERITIPAITLDVDNHIQTIRKQFTAAQVEGDEIDALRQEQARVVGVILREIEAELERFKTSVQTRFSTEEAKFIPGLTGNILATVEQLEKDLKDREKSLSRYESLLDLINADMQTLKTSAASAYPLTA